MPRKSGKRDLRIQTGLRLEPEILDQLRKSPLGVSEEIRRRLNWMLDLEPLDEPTRDLLRTVAWLASEVQLETGASWHEHSGAHAAFRQAILSALARVKPEGSTKFGDRPHQSEPSDDPQEIGIWAEYNVWSNRDKTRRGRENFRSLKEQTYNEILKLQQERKAEGEKS